MELYDDAGDPAAVRGQLGAVQGVTIHGGVVVGRYVGGGGHRLVQDPAQGAAQGQHFAPAHRPDLRFHQGAGCVEGQGPVGFGPAARLVWVTVIGAHGTFLCCVKRAAIVAPVSHARGGYFRVRGTEPDTDV